MSDPRFRLDAHLEGLYKDAPRELAFCAERPEQFTEWKQQLHARVAELLGLAGRTRPEPKAEKLSETDRDGYVEQKWALDVGEGVAAPMYLLVPGTDPPWKPILVTHGHSPSVGHILGYFANEDEAAERLALDCNYAQAPAQKGYFVCALEQRGFGERLSQDVGEGANTCTDRHMAFFLQMLGRTVIGERCWDVMCAIDYLQTRDDLAGGLAMTGNSGGGTTTVWASALDERITVSVPSCYFCSFKASIMDLHHCECNYVPGIAAVFEMGDLAAMTAPRPLRVIAGEQDNIFPIAAVREQFQTVQTAYDLLGASDNCSLAVHPGPHAYNHAFAQEWFAQWL